MASQPLTPDKVRCMESSSQSSLAEHRNLAGVEIKACLFEFNDPLFDQYLPFIPDEAYVDNVMQVITRNPLYKGFFQSSSKVKESALESQLRMICQLISNNPYRDRRPSTEFTVRLNKATKSDILGSTYKSDFLFVLRDDIPVSERKDLSKIPSHNGSSEGSMDSKDVAVFGEIKNSTTEICDSHDKIVRDATHNLYNDPTRQYSYGLTLEGEQLWLWYFSRSHCAKSVAICWSQRPALFVKVFSSFMFATVKELGYDSSVWRISGGQFVYEIGNKFFQTEDILSDYRSLCIPGRATRVWKVVQVKLTDDEQNPRFDPLDGIPKVLKDCWIDQKAKTDRSIQQDIFNRLEGLKRDMSDRLEDPKEDKSNIVQFLAAAQENCESDLDVCEWYQKLLNDYTSYFLTIDTPALPSNLTIDDADPEVVFTEQRHPPPHSSRVRVYDAPGHGKDDKSQNGLLRGQKSASGQKVSAVRAADNSKSQRERGFVPKKQCRLVFKEVCHATSDEEDFKNILKASLDCIGAMALMYSVGWIHRDISVGNLLIYRSPTTNEVSGILADLEYAKHRDDTSLAKDPKRGTPYFMALEVASHRFIPTQGFKVNLDHPRSRMKSRLGQEVKSEPTRPFCHHTVHDIESMFWVFFWFLTHDLPAVEWDDQSKKDLQVELNRIFNVTDPSMERGDLIFSDGRLDEWTTKVHPEFGDLVYILSVVASVLQETYKATTNPDSQAVGRCFGALLVWTLLAQEQVKTLSTTRLSRLHDLNADRETATASQEPATPSNGSGSKRSRDSREQSASNQASGSDIDAAHYGDGNCSPSQGPNKKARTRSSSSNS